MVSEWCTVNLNTAPLTAEAAFFWGRLASSLVCVVCSARNAPRRENCVLGIVNVESRNAPAKEEF